MARKPTGRDRGRPKSPDAWLRSAGIAARIDHLRLEAARRGYSMSLEEAAEIVARSRRNPDAAEAFQKAHQRFIAAESGEVDRIHDALERAAAGLPADGGPLDPDPTSEN